MPDTYLCGITSLVWWCIIPTDLAHTLTPRYTCSLFGLFFNNWRSYRKCLYIFCCCCLVTESGLTLCDPMDCSLPDSSIHGIFQARIQEWVVISFSRGPSWPMSPALAGGFFTTEPPRKPFELNKSPQITEAWHRGLIKSHVIWF